ncbi:hypothetical protein M3936_23195 [Sutcliffiella horikoshii]|uniref:hypothetical protein n=1 Tax=Sutcliffiella horikoshii TaxID=79883 RepID=UPI00203E7E3D|nr:hypothetical protein [Sutcliffiella horikoshii]MCM3620465.1 hypothetical protein [Sutcliffiella horikoshii]
MKQILISILFLLFLSGCSSGSGIDEEVLENLSHSLEKRWEYTESLPEDLTIENLKMATEIELEILQEYDIDDFKDPTLYSRYNTYKSRLNLMSISLITAKVDSEVFIKKWKEHMEYRAKILYDINSKHPLNFSDNNKEIFNEVLHSARRLVAMDEMKTTLASINGLSDIDLEIEDESIAISFPTESALSSISFVARKTGFPEKAMEILKIMTEYEFENIVIATTNQDTIAVSSYFTKEALNDINFDKWEDTDSYDAYKFYELTNAYHIRMGIWNSLDEETQRLLGDMNKEHVNPFWREHRVKHQ